MQSVKALNVAKQRDKIIEMFPLYLSWPIVVEPGSITGNDDVMSLLSYIVLSSIHPIDFSFALFIIILQIQTVL